MEAASRTQVNEKPTDVNLHVTEFFDKFRDPPQYLDPILGAGLLLEHARGHEKAAAFATEPLQ